MAQTLDEVLRAARRGRSQREIAAEVSAMTGHRCHHATVSKWERGETAPAPERWAAVEFVYGLDAGTVGRLVLGVADPARATSAVSVSPITDEAGRPVDFHSLSARARWAIRRIVG